MRHSHRSPPRGTLVSPRAVVWPRPSLALVAVAVWLTVSGAPFAHAAASGPAQAAALRRQPRVIALAGDVAAAKGRVDQLNAGIASVSSPARQHPERPERQAHRAAAAAQPADRRRRPGWRSSRRPSAADQRVLAQQLVGTLRGGKPDIVDVVLEATGFNDLLERLAFAQRIGQHDAHIVGNVKAARRAVPAEAIRLGALSRAPASWPSRRSASATRWPRSRCAWSRSASPRPGPRRRKAGQLAGAKDQVALAAPSSARLQAAQRPPRRRAPQPVGQPGSSGRWQLPVPRTAPSQHGFDFPMPKGDVSPPATWSLDDGVDIAAPGGTPELAVCSGTIVLHGIGGFGPSAPVLHCDSPLAGYDYVYYGHAGPGNWTPIGTHVSQGAGHLRGRLRDRRHLARARTWRSGLRTPAARRSGPRARRR